MGSYPLGEEKFNKFLLSEYLKFGNVDDVFREHRYSLPISCANYHRILNKYGIIKAAGPNSKISEMFQFLTRMIEKDIPLEKLYRKMPPSFMTSTATLYRILSYIKEGITRRVATGLVITPKGKDNLVLVANDTSTPRMDLGKPYNSQTIPMGFSRKRDSRESAILRVLQQEVFMKNAIDGNIPEIIPLRPKPFMYIDIADVRVEVFHLILKSGKISTNDFSSYKLQNYKFLDTNQVINYKKSKPLLRVGLKEIIIAYQKKIKLEERNLTVNPIYVKSELNYVLSR